MADMNEAGRQHMKEKAANELNRFQCHGLDLVPVGVVFPLEADPALGQGNQPTVGDSNPVRVARQVLENLLRSAERTLGVNHPFNLTGLTAQCLEGVRFGQRFQVSVELELTRLKRLSQMN